MLGTEDKIVNKTKAPLWSNLSPRLRENSSGKSWRLNELGAGRWAPAVRGGERRQLESRSEKEASWDYVALVMSGRGLDYIPGMWQFLAFTLHAEHPFKVGYLAASPMCQGSRTKPTPVSSAPVSCWSVWPVLLDPFPSRSSTGSSSLPTAPVARPVCFFLCIVLVAFCLAWDSAWRGGAWRCWGWRHSLFLLHPWPCTCAFYMGGAPLIFIELK